MSLFTQHVESLEARGIDIEAAEKAGLSSISAREVAVSLYGPDTRFPVYGDALRIPYYNLEGKPLEGDDGAPYVRHRIFDTRKPSELVGKEKAQRYLARPGCGVRPYLPLQYSSVASNAPFVVVTEGEFKAISASTHGLPAVGLAGVTMWAAETGSALTAETPIHPLLLEALSCARGVIVLADSDARGNVNVQNAMGTLANAITVQLKIPALYSAVPEAEKVQGKKTPKMGLDDWIEAKGASNVEKYLTWLWSKEMERLDVLSTGGFIPLGFQGANNYVWSILRKTMFILTAAQLTQPGMLMTIVGSMAWCIAAYGRQSRGGVVVVDWQSMGGDMSAACIAAGHFDPEKFKATGVVDVGHGVLAVNGGDVLFLTNGEAIERYGHGYVFQAGHHIGLRPDTPQATAEEVRVFFDAVGTWGFRSAADAFLVASHAMLGFLAGALQWRPHLSLTGARGTGKSALMSFLMRFMGKAGRKAEAGSSAAGTRQALGSDAVWLGLDEAEPDGRNISELIVLARSSSSGGEIYRGTQDQTGTSFSLHSMFMLAGIVPPVMTAADKSRFFCVELAQVNQAAVDNPHPLVSGVEDIAALGLRVFSRMVHAWPRFLRTQAVLRQYVGGDARYQQSVTPILAAAWVGLFDDEITEDDAKDFVAGFELDSSRTRATEAVDEQDALNHLLGKLIEVQVDGRNLRMTTAEVAARALEESRRGGRLGDFNRALGRLGLRVDHRSTWTITDGDDRSAGVHGTLLLNVKSPQLKSMLKETRWESGELVPVLKRLPGAGMSADSAYIGGGTCRPFAVPLPKLEDVLPTLVSAAELA